LDFRYGGDYLISNKAIKKIRKENNMTLAELGEKLGKSKQYMSELERGNIRLTYDMAVDIARVFNTTPDKIFLKIKSNNISQNKLA
jgi:putative transcriptional regulator